MVRRAEMELRGDVPRGMKCSGVVWEYWIGKWKLLSKEERRHAVLKKLIPKLESEHTVATNGQKKKPSNKHRQIEIAIPPPPNIDSTQQTLSELRKSGMPERLILFLAERGEVEWDTCK